MKVWGFVGSSGTGKSHRALEVAKNNDIAAIIDDGLFIKENLILAGASAKKEVSKLASIRRALFFDNEHAETIKKAIMESNINSIMILGTSQNMVDSIAVKLGLPLISEYIFINDVASDDDINAALNVRRSQGKHVIPAPTFALKKEFSGIFLDPLRRFVKKGKGNKFDEERTVVRPTFSYMGKYTISKTAIEQIICILTQKSKNIKKVVDIKVEYLNNGLGVELQLIILYGCIINLVLDELIVNIRREVEYQTALNVNFVNLTAKALVLD